MTQKLQDDIDAALATYHAIVDTANAAQLRAASDKVKSAKQALAAALTDGANPCPTCGGTPHGMLQPRGDDAFAVEIGCMNCKHHRARGGTRELATRKWNAGAAEGKPNIVENKDGSLSGLPKSWHHPKPR